MPLDLPPVRLISCRTLTDLPWEVLHIIVSQLAYDRAYVESCSFTCRLLRAVALEHLDFRHLAVPRITSFDPLLDFLSNYPRIAETVVSVRLRGNFECGNFRWWSTTTIDDTLVATIVGLLPKLESLVLDSFHYVMPTDSSLARCAVGPFPLFSFTICGPWNPRSSLTSALRVLSLFKPRQLGHIAPHTFDVSVPFEPRFLHRPLDTPQLSLSRSVFGGPTHTAWALQALSVSVRSDSLRELRVEVDSMEAVCALGELLRRAGCNITTLSIYNDRSLELAYRKGWVDALEDNWEMLNVSACTKLKSFELPMDFRENSARPLSETPVGILQQASPTLRKVTIDVHGLLESATIGSQTVFKLHDFDILLSPTRFPHLEHFELRIRAESNCKLKMMRRRDWSECVKSVRKDLESLHARGLLKVTQLQL